jgi:hypothetical protein
MKINLLPLLKGAASLVASAGIGAVVENAIRSTTPVDIGKFNKILTMVGQTLLTGF